jgi:ATP-dependent DNA helicase RecQ
VNAIDVMTAICDSELLTTLQKHFGHQTFRPGQEQLVDAVLSGRDVLAVMPTGSGKSLGYQLPAVVLPGTTLVVSPLISLMKDQVDELDRRGIASAALHSMLSIDSRRDVLNAARAGRLRLLYVAPERFASDSFVRLLGAAVAAGLIAISNDRYRTLSLTAHGRDVMSGRAENLRMSSPVRSPRLSSLRHLRADGGFAHRRRRVFGE